MNRSRGASCAVLSCSLALALWQGAGCGSADDTSNSRGSAARGAFGGAGNAALRGGGALAGGGANDFGSATNSLLPMADPNAPGLPGCRNATIAFVVDGSGSMCEPFGNSTRWTELRTALLDKTNGLIYRLQASASFGMYLYDGSIDFQLLSQAGGGGGGTCMSPGTFQRAMGGDCPQIIEVKPARANATQIDQKYPATELGGSTPTDKAMNYVVDQLLAARGPSGVADEPQYIILATDGQPNDICMGGTGGDGSAQQQGVVAAADRAAQAGITTFVISLASDPALQMHLDEVARHGNPADPMAHTFSPSNSADLVMTLTGLLGDALGCLF